MTIAEKMILKSQQIAQQIKESEKLNKPIENLVKQQINLLEEFHDVFVKHADKQNFSLLDKVSGEVQIYGNLRMWAKKIGLPIDKYEKKIFDLRASIFGEENTKKLFKPGE